MRLIISLLAIGFTLAFFTSDCLAQTAKADTTFKPHWEIGVDLLPLIDKENVPKTTLFARRNYSLKNGAGKAWRLRAGVDTEVRDFIDVGRWTPDTYRTYAPYLSIGHEWQRTSGVFRWFAGIEAVGSYYRQNFFYLLTLSDSLRWKGFKKEFKIGMNGTLGCQVKLANNLWLSSEAALSVAYRRSHYKGDDIHIDGTLGGYSDNLEKVFVSEFRPLYVINLIYSLKSIRHANKKT